MRNKFALLKEKITLFKNRKPKWFEYKIAVISLSSKITAIRYTTLVGLFTEQ